MGQCSKIVCLSNVYDDAYLEIRREKLIPSLSSPKRRDLASCLEEALGREVVFLSSPPKALDRTKFQWLPAVTTTFSKHRQLFCENWDGPKLRLPLAWIFYAQHVLRNVRDGDIIIIDNYEIIYIIAAWALRFRRKVTFVLEYEDGKHLIDKGFAGILSSLAEILGKRLIHGAILTHPGLGMRLPKGIPTELVPGFVIPSKPRDVSPPPPCPVSIFRFTQPTSWNRTPLGGPAILA